MRQEKLIACRQESFYEGLRPIPTARWRILCTALARSTSFANTPWPLASHSRKSPTRPSLLGASAPPRQARRSGQGSPTHPPCSLAVLLGRVGGAASRMQQRRPTCPGTDRCGNDRAASAAKKPFQMRPALCKWPLAATASIQKPTMAFPKQLGPSRAAPGLSLPPTRPAAWPSFRGGGKLF